MKLSGDQSELVKGQRFRGCPEMTAMRASGKWIVQDWQVWRNAPRVRIAYATRRAVPRSGRGQGPSASMRKAGRAVVVSRSRR